MLLHGWLQEHSAWLKTATALRDLYGHSVLLLDFYGHGHSPSAPSSDSDSPAGYCALLADRLQALGWHHGPKFALAGCSMGAAVAMRFACAHPGRISRLTLVAPPGLPEPWYMPCHPVRELTKLVCALSPLGDGGPRSRAASLLRVIRTTPTYGVEPDKVIALAEGAAASVQGAAADATEGNGCFVTVLAAQLDLVHSPHAQFWRAAAKRCEGGARGDGDLRGSDTTRTGSSDAADEQSAGLLNGWSGAFADTSTSLFENSHARSGRASSAPDAGSVDSASVAAAGEVATSEAGACTVSGAGASREEEQPAGLRYVLLRGWSHWGVCTHLYELGLHLDESLWHGAAAGGEASQLSKGAPSPPLLDTALVRSRL